MANNAARVDDTGSFSDWYRELPPITKFFITGTMGCACATSFNLIPASWGGASMLVFNWEMIKTKFQVWRLITPFLFAGGFSINFVMHMFILYENCKRYEANPFNTGAGGTSTDMFYMIFCGGAIFVLLGIFESTLGFGMVVMSEPILYMILYVWSRREPEMGLKIWGFPVKAKHLPWVYMGIRVVMGGGITQILIGIAVGHLFYFLVDVVPAQHNMELIKTPKWAMDFMTWATSRTQGPTNVFIPPGRREGGAGAGVAATTFGGATAQPDGLRNRGGYQWGRGNVLGTGGR